MRKHRGRMPSHSTFVAYLSLFLVLTGGTALALDGKNTVFSDDITNGEVKTADINNNSVSTDDISDTNGVRSADVLDDTIAGGGLGSVDIAPDSLTGSDIADTSSLTTDEIEESKLFNDNSIDATDVSNSSTLTGSEINESTLSSVPNASTVGFQSVTRIGFEASNGSGATGFGNIGDLNLSFKCDGATGDLTLQASTDLDNATLAVSDDGAYFDDEDFDTADGLIDILTPLGGDSDAVINLIYVNGAGFGIHDKVTAQFLVLDQAPPGTQSECIVDGHAIVSNDT